MRFSLRFNHRAPVDLGDSMHAPAGGNVKEEQVALNFKVFLVFALKEAPNRRLWKRPTFMKYPAISLSLMCMAFASQAQQPPEASAPSSKLDASSAQRVASPNRTSSRTWAASSKGGEYRQHGERGGKADAIIWVNSAGKPVGRAIGNFGILTTLNNQLVTITGLYPDQNCDANRVCTYPNNGARWLEFESVYYTTSDCNGMPYSPSGAMGTPYLGSGGGQLGGLPLFFQGG